MEGHFSWPSIVYPAYFHCNLSQAATKHILLLNVGLFYFDGDILSYKRPVTNITSEEQPLFFLEYSGCFCVSSPFVFLALYWILKTKHCQNFNRIEISHPVFCASHIDSLNDGASGGSAPSYFRTFNQQPLNHSAASHQTLWGDLKCNSWKISSLVRLQSWLAHF